MNKSTPSIENILEQAVEIATPKERQAFVEQACGGDRALQRRVEQLIANHFQAGSFLERPAVALDPDGTAGWQTAESTDGVGTVIGPYKLLEQIGEGGMGLGPARGCEPCSRQRFPRLPRSAAWRRIASAGTYAANWTGSCDEGAGEGPQPPL